MVKANGACTHSGVHHMGGEEPPNGETLRLDRAAGNHHPGRQRNRKTDFLKSWLGMEAKSLQGQKRGLPLLSFIISGFQDCLLFKILEQMVWEIQERHKESSPDVSVMVLWFTAPCSGSISHSQGLVLRNQNQLVTPTACLILLCSEPHQMVYRGYRPSLQQSTKVGTPVSTLEMRTLWLDSLPSQPDYKTFCSALSDCWSPYKRGRASFCLSGGSQATALLTIN